MSKKDPNDGMTDEMQAFDEKFGRMCANSFRKLSVNMQMGCVNRARNMQIIHQATLDKAEREKLQKQISSVEQKNDMRSFVNQWLDRWQTHASLILAAVVTASEDYNLILNTKASQPLGAGLILDLAILFVPEIKGLEKVFEILGKKKYSKEMVETAKSFLKVSKTDPFSNWGKIVKSDRAHSVANQFDKRADDIIGAIRNNISSNKSVDAASQQLAAAHDAKNQIFKELLGNTISNLIMVTNLAAGYYYLIDILSSESVKNVITNLIKWSGLDSFAAPIPNANQYEILSQQILYDMLRAYVKAYFVVRTTQGSGGKTIDTMPDKLTLTTGVVSGLDDAQREMIYAKFGKVPWKANDRPPVNSYKDLVKFWGAKFDIVYLTAADYADRYRRD